MAGRKSRFHSSRSGGNVRGRACSWLVVGGGGCVCVLHVPGPRGACEFTTSLPDGGGWLGRGACVFSTSLGVVAQECV